MVAFYIDPQSYSNLALYDYNLLKCVNNEVVFIGSSLYDQEIPSNVHFLPYFTYNNKNLFLKGISYILSLFKIARKVKEKCPELVHIQWIRLFWVDYIFLKWLMRKNCKVVYTVHNTLPHDDIKEKTFRFFKRYYNLVDSLIVHTEVTKKELITKFGVLKSKISVIPHGLLEENCDDGLIQEYVSRINKENRLKDKLVFTCLGAQSYYKGFDLVEQLWTESPMFGENNDLHLIVAGKATKGVNYDRLQNYSNVTILNYFLSKEEFQAVIMTSDIILLPYRNISQSGVLLSALSKNKPVIVSDKGGLTDPFKCGKVGWIIGDPNYSNFKYWMSEIIKGPDEVKQISQDIELWQRIKYMFSWEQIGELTLNLYKVLVEHEGKEDDLK